VLAGAVGAVLARRNGLAWRWVVLSALAVPAMFAGVVALIVFVPAQPCAPPGYMCPPVARPSLADQARDALMTAAMVAVTLSAVFGWRGSGPLVGRRGPTHLQRSLLVGATVLVAATWVVLVLSLRTAL
jgi:hypothetical protein